VAYPVVEIIDGDKEDIGMRPFGRLRRHQRWQEQQDDGGTDDRRRQHGEDVVWN
jgi:hypothetical protein